MSGGKKRSGFQITGVTSDFAQTPAGQSAPSRILTVLQSAAAPCVHQGSSSQPTSPSVKRKTISQDALGQSSRFRVVQLVQSRSGNGGRGLSYRRGRWTCLHFVERQEGEVFRRAMDSMRQAHSLESLEMIGQNRVSNSQDTTHVPAQPIRKREGTPPLHSRLPNQRRDPIDSQARDNTEPMRAKGLDSTPSLRPRNIPPPLRLDVDATGRPGSPPAGPFQSPLTPLQTAAGFSLDKTTLGLAGDASSSTTSLVAIDNKIEQAMDLVKSHLMLAVREEVELLKEQIRELQEKNQQLEKENHILRAVTHSHT